MDTLVSKAKELKDAEVEARKQPGCALIFPATLNMAAGIAMLAVGASHKEQCDGKIGEEASMFLIVGGAIILASSLTKLLSYSPFDFLTKLESLGILFDMAFFIACIWGSVKVFGDYAAWGDEATGEDDKCPGASYMFAFVYLVCYWLLMPLLCCCSCCCTMLCCAGMKRQADVEAA